MCGLAGFIDLTSRAATYDLEAQAVAMADRMRLRGPDDGGVWSDSAAGVALAQRRLSIVDLSPAGHQPMVSASGRFVIVYNGEVYSHQDIRPELEARGIRFRGYSDTEVILESCAAFGVAATVARLIGMFAFALWDREERTLTLVRDRLGIKPLYWGQFGDLFLFGSELKALRAHNGWAPVIDRAAAASFLRRNCVPSPQSIYQGVHKLQPGRILVLRPHGRPSIETYWDARQVAVEGQRHRLAIGDSEAVDRLETLLADAVGRRMIADVPLGALLSGGIDSSAVVALMQAQSDRPVKTFSIGFEAAGFDEAGHAKAVAAHLGTDHTELYLSPADALAVVPKLPEMFDEPFADSSQIPTFLVSEMARRHVTVALSGDGGDELFAGYNRHVFAAGSWQRLRQVPPTLRRLLAGAISSFSPAGWDQVARLLPSGHRPARPGEMAHKLATVLVSPDDDALYQTLTSHWSEPGRAIVGASGKGEGPDPLASDLPSTVERMQLGDLTGYLPDDILTKVDRASMAVSLEARVPLLDHRVVEFAWSLPAAMKIRRGTSKWILRQVLYRHVPRSLVERPKMGFAVPLAGWLRGPLRDWAEDLLDADALTAGGLVRAAPVRALWDDHLAGRDRHFLLWDVLMLEAWRRHWMA
ncbi:asparagine synthase (glutamine-hydrolyzing) [Telmatospirillum sp.]|uniref:asparagine synthase (glutamine-hydrolyzing) n=1 Tax=Telmatospirillum sp. TaxID=2079197 RepID=UPI0028474CD5|nr:asparagine synthase (glutamine-hydrolyzing) [Telmatospirillum sp.]MDR3441052.1 asparagine synthase (glutamine-hydrolyzing) [Telmatospirillum sp.]